MEAELLSLEGLETDEELGYDNEERGSEEAEDSDAEEEAQSTGATSDETSVHEAGRESLPYEPESEEEFTDDEDVDVGYLVGPEHVAESHIHDETGDSDDSDNESNAGDDSLVALREKLRTLYEDSF